MKTNLLFRVALVLSFISVFTGKMSAQSDNVGLCGPAAINGWIENGPVMMIQDQTNLNQYTFNGYLSAGQFKFSTNAGWTPCWGPVTTDTPLTNAGFTGALVAADNKFLVQTAGNYSITIDLNALTVNISAMTETTPIMVNRLFIIGSATANGWNLGTAPELVKTEGNPWEYTYTGNLLASGSFKIATSKGDWSQKMYVKTSDVLMNLGGADVQWTVPADGNYKVVLNTNTLAISITTNTATNISRVNREFPTLKSNVVTNELIVLNTGAFNYQVYNIAGASLMKGNSSNGAINVSTLSKGIYFLSVDNKSVKFIKY